MRKLISYFIKETLVAFYKIGDKFVVQKQIIKNSKILSTEDFEFNEEEFLKFINSCYIENTQTYISTIIDTFNQGCVDSCSHTKYKELGINIDNIKILCLKNYSIFIGMYELNNFIKENEKYKIDYVFSPYLLVDINKKDTKNSIYIFIDENFVIVLIYEDGIKPKYSNIYQFKVNDESMMTDEVDNSDDIDGVDDLDDIDLVDDIEELDDIEDLDDDIDSIDDINDIAPLEDSSENIKEDIKEAKNEIETLEFVKNCIKDYYEDYSENFLEYGYVLSSELISEKFVKTLKDETFLELKSETIDVLGLINDLALKELNV